MTKEVDWLSEAAPGEKFTPVMSLQELVDRVSAAPAEVILDLDRITALHASLRYLSEVKKPGIAAWARGRLEDGTQLTTADEALAWRYEEELQGARSAQGARPAPSLAQEEAERSTATAKTSARRAPSHFIGAK